MSEVPLYGPLGPLGFEGAQHRQTLRPSVDGVRSKALRPFGRLVPRTFPSGAIQGHLAHEKLPSP